MFRLQDNVPDIYVNQSRDFQLFCRIYDYVNNAVHSDIGSILNILDTLQVQNSLLELYCSKLGFFTNLNIESPVLRHILKAFPLMIKYKGTKTAVEIAVAALLRSQTAQTESFYVDMDLKQSHLNIYINIYLENEDILKELFKYILPIGMTYSISPYTTETLDTTDIGSEEHLMWYTTPTTSISQAITNDRDESVVGSDFGYEVSDSDNITKDNFFDKTFSTVGMVSPVATSGMADASDVTIDNDGTARANSDKVNKNDIKEYPPNGGNNG